jgi:hypothetical protein
MIFETENPKEEQTSSLKLKKNPREEQNSSLNLKMKIPKMNKLLS